MTAVVRSRALSAGVELLKRPDDDDDGYRYGDRYGHCNADQDETRSALRGVAVLDRTEDADGSCKATHAARRRESVRDRWDELLCGGLG
jgi:hypothetical protein